MRTRLFVRSFATKPSVLIVGFLMMTTGCRHTDTGMPATDFLFGAVSVVGDFIRAFLAAFLF